MLTVGDHLPVRRITPRPKTLPELFVMRCEETPDRPAIFEKTRGGWEPITWRGFLERARKAALGLRKLGVKSGDRVAVLGPTRSPWAVYDMAVQLLGGVGFGIYPKQTPQQIRYLLEHSEAKVVLVSSREEIDAVIEAASGLSTLVAIVPWEEELVEAARAKDPRVVSPSELAGEAMSMDDVRASVGSISPDTTAILVYTSGTTGPPKGAMVAHSNIVKLLHATRDLTELFEDDVSLNFLPMAHAAERIFGFFARIDTGVATAYARSMGSVLEDVADVKPTLFGAVPRIFEKAYAKVQSELQKKPPAVQKLFAWAVGVGKAVNKLELAGQPVPKLLALQKLAADRLVYRKIRGAFGGRVRYFITGAAPIALEILEFFWAMGLPIYEVYGMTEATVVTHANRPGHVKLGTVGKVIAPLENKIAEDGEILLRGPWVFQGYYKDAAASAEALADGWLHTGDIGSLDAEGYLRITDRKKHLIITAGGKNLAPANIENAIKNQDPLISQVYAHGDRKPFVVAIVAPSPLETLAWGKDRGVVTAADVDRFTRELLDNPAGRSAALNEAMAKVIAHPDFTKRINEAVAKGNRDLAHVEQVRRFAVLDRDFSQEAGELTPTMKLKRKSVESLHGPLIETIYEGGGIEV